VHIKEFLGLESELRRAYKRQHVNLCLKYVTIRSPAQKGDLVEDHIGVAKVLRISVSIPPSISATSLPKCIYACENLTRKGKVSKTVPSRIVWETNLVKVRGEPIDRD